MRGINVQITNAAPASVNTDFHRGRRAGPAPALSAEQCADTILAGFDKGRRIVFIKWSVVLSGPSIVVNTDGRE